MANIVTDLRRATSEINEIHDVLIRKGVMGGDDIVPFEDYSERIEDIRSTVLTSDKLEVIGKKLVVKMN